jgi:signal transduction histidine kinase
MLGGAPPSPEMECLVLLATVGDQPQWNSRKDSQGHQAVPLTSTGAEQQAPMISHLLTQMGLTVGMIIEPAPELLLDMEQITLNVFYIPEALGSPYIPAQKEFVVPFGIRSAIGFGGFLPSGQMYAVVIFFKIPIARETAELFKFLSLNVKTALLPFMGRLFADTAAMGSSSLHHDLKEPDLRSLNSRITAMEQLIAVYERTVVDQADKLYEEIIQRKRDAEEIRRLNAELRQKIRELGEIQEELIHKEKLAFLGQLSGGVGHELRNPFGVILNAVFFLEMTLVDPDETVKEYLEIIKDEINHSLRIITDLLDFAGTKTPRPRVISARELIDESLKKCQIPDGITLKIELPESLPRLMVDPHQIQQMLQNLVTNGIQAMPQGGLLRVEAHPVRGKGENHKQTEAIGCGVDGNFIQISIEDTGEGISAENVEKLFQPLFTTKARGIGLGLVLCRNLTEINGGWIEVKSDLGKGATFSAILPVAREPA